MSTTKARASLRYKELITFRIKYRGDIVSRSTYGYFQETSSTFYVVNDTEMLLRCGFHNIVNYLIINDISANTMNSLPKGR